MSDNLRHYYLQQMGIENWVVREAHTHKKNLAELAAEVSTCVRCPLHQTRTQTVFARGNLKANLMIIGEAPGFQEDKQGLPFVGNSGVFFNKMLNSIGLSGEDVYFANLLKCRPPENRDPQVEEITKCSDYLAQQIVMVAPKLILAAGHFAAEFLLNTTSPLNKMRNKVHDYQGTPIVVSYHPAHLLRNPADKKNAYSDLLLVKRCLQV